MKNNRKYQSILQIFLLIAIILLANVAIPPLFNALHLPKRFDLTKEGRFSLTPATKKMLSEIDDVVYVQVFLEGELPSGFKRLQNEIRWKLDDFRAYTGGYLEYEFVDPFENLNGEQRQRAMKQLVEKGLQPKNLIETAEGYSEKVIFPAALVFYKGRELPVMLLQEQLNKGPQETLNNSIALLEYQIANAIQKIQRKEKPTLGFLTGHGELDSKFLESMAVELAQYYFLERYNVTENLYISPKFSAIVIAKPTETFDDKDKFKIDQYVMNGGRVLWLIDNMAANMDSLKNEDGSFLPLAYDLQLDDLLFKYGARVNFNFVKDLQCADIQLATGRDPSGNATQLRPFKWPYFPIFTYHHPTPPVTKNIDAVLGRFAGSIDTIRTKGANIKKDILLTTSPASQIVTTMNRVDVNEVRQKPDFNQYNKGQQAVAVALEGEFPSLFKNRLAKSTIDMIDTLQDVSFREKSLPTKMIVMSDGDIIRNGIDARTGRPNPLGYYKYSQQTFANKELLVNAVEWLTDDNGIIAARSKDVKMRLLDNKKVQNEKTFWQLLNMLLPIVLVIFAGFVYTFFRKRKYMKG